MFLVVLDQLGFLVNELGQLAGKGTRALCELLFHANFVRCLAIVDDIRGGGNFRLIEGPLPITFYIVFIRCVSYMPLRL